MFQRVGAAAYKKDLTNTIRLCEILGNPHDKFRSIHIAGTNGKGSVTHMLAAVYQAAGLRVGVYSSPHLVDFRERIKINGEYISEAEVIDFVERMRPHLPPGPLKGESNPKLIEPSFFELTVAMAFEHFARHQVDLAMIEVGLGGRLDSTNVITPLLSVITNIALDHQEFLGNTLVQIAGEKAGIIKPGVPVVIGERHPETEPVFRRRAEECGSEIAFAEDVEQIELVSSDVDSITVRSANHREINVGCGAWYQLKNVATVLTAVDVLKRLELAPEAPMNALRHFKQLTNFQGRWDVLSHEPLMIADGAHNPAGLQQTFHQLHQLLARSRKPETTTPKLHVVFGMVKDKDISATLSVLPSDARYYFCKPGLPRGLDEAELLDKARHVGLNGQGYATVAEALRSATANAHPHDIVFICGSLFVVGEALQNTSRFQRAAPAFTGRQASRATTSPGDPWPHTEYP